LQVWVPEQTVPQAPQFWFDVKLTHWVPHLCWPTGQLVAQALRTHTSPVGQTVLQPPQCCTSLVVVTHCPLQSVVPVGQEQLDAVHVAPPTQATPQAPQLEPSVAVLTHDPLHGVVGGSHVAWQWPVWQTEPVPQAVPQVPQLCASLCVSMHAPLHSDCPIGQVQVELTQLAPVPQACPHVPQLLGSEAVRTHDPLQLVSPAAHCVHCPVLHDCEEPHALPHAPQLP
jgi:hypothetical protein